MEYIDIPDNHSKNPIQKYIWRLKSNFSSNHGYNNKQSTTVRGKFKFASIIIFIFCIWMYIIPTKSYNERFLLKDDLRIDAPSYNMKTSYESLIFKYNKLPDEASLRAKLSFHFPYDKDSTIPHNVFQTWKVKPNDKKFPMNFHGPFESWSEKNPNFKHSLITDDMLDDWVYQEFSNVPEIIKAWDLMPAMILKADFFRYLVIFARGGVYSDMDTFCLKPIEDWTPFNGKEDVGFAVGIEADPDRPDWSEWYARRIQFVQWTIVGKKGHPFLRELIARVVEETFRKESMHRLKSIEGKDEGGDVMSWTGPGIFTDTMFDYLNNVLTNGEYGDGFGIGTKYWNEGSRYNLKHQEVDDEGLPLNANQMEINYKKFTGLVEPIVYDDIVVLPITSFSPGVGQMGSKSPTHPLAFVLHNFQGSWKPS